MAPKNKFTRDEMVAAAVQVVRTKGIDKLTAQALAAKLGTSTQPVFTCFSTMDTVRAEVRAAAEALYHAYSSKGLQEDVPFFGFGLQYIRFAREEPELYRLLFLTPGARRGNGAFGSHASESAGPSSVPLSCDIYHISATDADRYFRDLWLVVHSLATLIVTNSCPYSDAEIEQILTGFSLSLCKAIKEIPGFTAGAFHRDALFRALTTEA